MEIVCLFWVKALGYRYTEVGAVQLGQARWQKNLNHGHQSIVPPEQWSSGKSLILHSIALDTLSVVFFDAVPTCTLTLVLGLYNLVVNI